MREPAAPGECANVCNTRCHPYTPERGETLTNHHPTDERQDGLAHFRERLQEPAFRRTHVEMLSIASLLQGSIVDRTYSVPDALVRGLTLSDLGTRVYDAVRAARPRLKPNDVKLALFLAVGCPEGLFCSDQSDVEVVRKGLSQEILRRRIHFPFVWGRDLHDLAAQFYPAKFNLDLSQSLNLLKSLPIGVFQEGLTTTGPFGALSAPNPRYIPSRNAAPGYLCSDLTCDDIHPITLSTANYPPHIAPANRAFSFVSDYVQREYGNREDPFARALRDAVGIEENNFRISAPEAVVDTLSDGLSLAELKTVMQTAFRLSAKNVGLRSWAVALSRVIGDPNEFIDGLSHAELVQLALLHTDEQLAQAIDGSISTGKITLSEYEVRARRIVRSGRRGVSAEIGSRGLRLVGGGAFVARRLQELIHHIYFESGKSTPEDLAYVLGEPYGEPSGTELLDKAVRAWSPEDVLRKLVLASRSAFEATVERLGIEPALAKDQEEALQTLLWKLGATSRSLPRSLDKIAALEGDLRQASHEADDDRTRGVISNLFAALEAALRSTLEFSTWALTNDHYVDDESFVYDPAPNPKARLAFIDQHAPTSDAKILLRASDDNTLVPLGAGFARLRKALAGLAEDAYLRSRDQLPLECREGALEFAFMHTLPFFDLDPEARAATLEHLARLAQLVQDETLLRVRNAPLHGAREFPTLDEMTIALGHISELRLILGKSGLLPTAFRLESTAADSMGRATATYYSDDRTRVDLYHPTWKIAPRLPDGKLLVILPTGNLGAPGPLRFRIKSRPGSDPYWNDWPKRWDIAGTYGRPEVGHVGEMAETRASSLG